eukprot:1320617-Lingulodinium_polyedra.AAC.1
MIGVAQQTDLGKEDSLAGIRESVGAEAEDLRTLPVHYEQGGRRHRDFASAVTMLTENGICLWLLQAYRARG